MIVVFVFLVALTIFLRLFALFAFMCFVRVVLLVFF